MAKWIGRRWNSPSQIVEEVITQSDSLRSSSDRRLWELSIQLQQQATSKSHLENLLPLAYALVRETARRVHQQSHYDVQILAGLKLFAGDIVEMQTGEGKTLAALLPAFVYALVGNGCHLITANDYLAKRDAKFAQAVFERLGLTVGCLHENLTRLDRPAEYARDITYGTVREFGFDFLKDRLAGSSERVQREHFFALVDEADSVMIDDARTPLLIAGESAREKAKQDLVESSHFVSCRLAIQSDFELNPKHRTATLTKLGCLNVLKRFEQPLVLRFGKDEVFEQVENSLVANHLFQRGQQYVVNNDEVVIVDESTGRIADGRKWQNGLHQAIEVKESVSISSGTETLAKITVQSYFRKYRHLAGLTGTAMQAANEFKKVYDRRVSKIPTRKPSQRIGLPNRIFATFKAKASAVAVEAKRRQTLGQAILIGTPSVENSLQISAALKFVGVAHEVLNCQEHESESRIIEHAGQPSRVTVATNMAGRGTDIHVSQAVQELGGLHIIATARHTSSRIDRQLIGRTARQGQPGSFQFFLSLEDDLFSIGGSQPSLKSRIGNGSELGAGWIKQFDRVQSKIEKLHEKQRLDLQENEHKQQKLCRQIGLDPSLEALED